MLIVAAAVIAIALAVYFMRTKQRSDELRQRFGPEYERTVRETGDVNKAEAALAARAARVERLQIRLLGPDDARRFSDRWRTVQARFVDDPRRAVTEADRLIGEVMHARGYPVSDFERRVEDISVDHPDVVMNYRAAREIAEEHARGHATTEDLRQAMVHYRALFADLLEEKMAAHDTEAAPLPAAARRTR
jgi:hypothetical protein